MAPDTSYCPAVRKGERLDSLLALVNDPTVRIIAEIAGGIILLGLAATALALTSYWNTRTWVRVQGRITRAEAGFELLQPFKSEQPRNHRVAKISYEYQVGGKLLRSNKIWPSGTPPEEETDGLLKRFPVDSAVKVFHEPRNPNNSALDLNGPPPQLAMGCLVASLIVIAIAAIAIWLATSGMGQLQGWFPGAIMPAMLIAAAIGVLMLVMFVATARQNAAAQRWPTTGGRIALSTVEQFQMLRDSDNHRHRRRMTETRYMPVVEYSYSVGGRDYTSRSIWADTEVSGNRKYAEGIAARYKPGVLVIVRYDPDKPQRAALEVGARWHWILLILAIVAFGIAAATSGRFASLFT